MNRRIFSILIVLMSIALIGIIAVQTFWIRNAMIVKREQFDRAINDALSDAVKQLEKKETVYLISKNNSLVQTDSCDFSSFDIKTSISESSDSNNIFVVKCDSVYKNKRSQSVRFELNDDNLDGKNLVKYFKKDSVKYIDDSMCLNIMSDKNDSLKVVIQQIFDDKDKKINIILSEIMHELEFKDIPISQRIDFSEMRKFIDKALHDRDIHTPYYFGIENDGEFFPSDSLKIDIQNPDLYKIKLFSDDVVENKVTLYVLFPDRDNFILKNIGWLLSGS
ncbi:MAG: hypothetical protein ABIJ97_06815, partial [Bacteroidota bacterium]